MKKILLLGSVLGFLLSFPTKIYAQCANVDSVFISEIHYDNTGTDVNEGIEITGPAGTDLSCYKIYLYNGKPSQRKVYAIISLSGTIDDEGCGYGAVWVPYAGIQNGNSSNTEPDGMALVNSCAGDTVIMFISYEGSFTAVDGPAAGMTSVDIGVFEPGNADPNGSLQLAGAGYCYADIVASGGWQSPALNTADSINPGLTDLRTCSVGPPDSLRFNPTSCIEPNTNTAITVCATDSAGNVVTSYTGTIVISKLQGPGNISGTLTATAVNGCATFNVSFDAVGDYLLGATDGTLIGNSDTITVSNSCPPPCPLLKRILVDACNGGLEEGINEYVVIQNGQSSINVDDITITFPSGGTFCNSGCGTNTWVSNQTFVNQLNATAGCVPPLFIDAIANGGTIPPGAIIVVFTGASPTYNFDFSNECGRGPYYAIFANNNNVSGRYLNYSNDCSLTRTTDIDIGSCATSSYTYQPCKLTDSDGDMVSFDANGNPTYENDSMCSTIILPVIVSNFSLIKYSNKIELFWQLPAEAYNIQLLKSVKPIEDFQVIAQNLHPQDIFSDYQLNASELFYKLRWQNQEGRWQESNVLNVIISEIEDIQVYPNPVKDKIFVKGIAAQKTIILMNQLGQTFLQQEVNSSQEASEILSKIFETLPQGTYILKIGNVQKLLIKL